MLGLLGALAAGAGLGCLLARAAGGGAAGLRDASYDRGYHHGWRDGYDQGYAAARDGPLPSPAHALTFDEARAGAARAALGAALSVARSYQPSGLYRAGAYDCDDMAEELWAACGQAGVPSFLVVGNTRVDNEDFDECDHCWVVVFCVDEAAGQEVTLAVDPLAQLVGAVEGLGAAGIPGAAGGGATLARVSAQYAEGFFYEDPAVLRKDLATRW